MPGPELTEEDRRFIRDYAARRARGEEIPGYSIPADSWSNFEEFMEQVDRVLDDYRADRAAGRAE